MNTLDISNDKFARQLNRRKKLTKMKNDWLLYLLIAPTVIATIVFLYLPMPGLIMSFMEYDVFKGFLGRR